MERIDNLSLFQQPTSSVEKLTAQMKLKDMNMLDKLSIVSLTHKAPESANTTERKRAYEDKV